MSKAVVKARFLHVKCMYVRANVMGKKDGEKGEKKDAAESPLLFFFLLLLLLLFYASQSRRLAVCVCVFCSVLHKPTEKQTRKCFSEEMKKEAERSLTDGDRKRFFARFISSD